MNITTAVNYIGCYLEVTIYFFPLHGAYNAMNLYPSHHQDQQNNREGLLKMRISHSWMQGIDVHWHVELLLPMFRLWSLPRMSKSPCLQ